MSSKSTVSDTLASEGYRINVSDILMATLTINILSLALPVMTLQVYDRILPNPGSGTLPVLIAGVCVAVVLETCLRLGRSYLTGWSGASFEHRLSCKAMSHILGSDLARLDFGNMGESLSRLAAIGRLKDFYNGHSVITIFDLMFVPLFLALIVYIAGPLAIMPACVLAGFTVVSLAQGSNLRHDLEQRDRHDDNRYSFLIESLEGIHTIKSFSLEKIFTRKYEHLDEESTLSNFKVTQSSALTFNTGMVFSSLMIASVIGAGAYFVLIGTITSGALIATILLSGRIMQPVQRALALWAKYQDYALSRERVERIFELPLHSHSPVEGDAPAREGTLSWHDVTFGRDVLSPLLLDKTNLDIQAGECVSITADQSSALSALLDISSGLFAPDNGSVMIDGRNTMQYRPEELMNHIGYVRSEGIIFRGTIRDNLTCFNLIDITKIQEIAALLHLDREIAELPSGYDTFLTGSSLDSITPGLKQKICVTRVLAPRPKIILFDNADRSLDREGYNQIYNLITRLKGKATLVLSSDDHNLTAHASRHLHLSAGKIIEKTPANTVPAASFFKEMRI